MYAVWFLWGGWLVRVVDVLMTATNIRCLPCLMRFKNEGMCCFGWRSLNAIVPEPVVNIMGKHNEYELYLYSI